MEQQVSLDCEVCLHPENISKDGDHGVMTYLQDRAALQQPVKKQTRQWAAWTRQEEESFFTALRQVGKNFEKITCRVQSKNKDQVRHYYYRLVRRMNRLLGPQFCLDAKNSKDTNAAMLRWWSLLEKFSCKASKLHLKPRRFKIFIETLEHQLLKDRKKSIRKRPQGENCPTTASTAVPNQGRASGHDARAVKLVLVGSPNTQQFGSEKGSSFKRTINIGTSRSNCREESTPVKVGRQRRKPGTVSTAAYKRWEKAALAGVSLVADAAEHLERSATDKEAEHIQGTQGQEVFDPIGKGVPSLLTSTQNLFLENNVQTSMKLKLQLFPIDEGTRRALEMENHNPHLELTLSTRKKISSVLEHLNRKWGNSSIASGELMLFPYWVQRENLVGDQKWNQDSALSAADVHALIGSPPIFRLRYGWFSNTELGSATFQATLPSSTFLGEHITNIKNMNEPNLYSVPVSTPPADCEPEKPMDLYKDHLGSGTFRILAPSTRDLPSETIESISVDPKENLLESSNHASTISWQRRETGNGSITRQVENMDPLKLCNSSALSAGEWADGLTNISVGDLLSESHNMDVNYFDPQLPGSSQCLQQIPFSCDSFDAAIAAHIYKHHSKTGYQPVALASHDSSFLDAEETCDAFSFQKNTVFGDEVQNASRKASPEACKQISTTSSVVSDTDVEELPEEEPMDDDPVSEDAMDECESDPQALDSSAKDLNELTDIYWPDSLGPLNLDIPSCRYHSDDLILSDSFSGLNHLIASSLDAFQNCSFFGLDKKEPVSTVEAREAASFSDCKIGSEV